MWLWFNCGVLFLYGKNGEWDLWFVKMLNIMFVLMMCWLKLDYNVCDSFHTGSVIECDSYRHSGNINNLIYIYISKYTGCSSHEKNNQLHKRPLLQLWQSVPIATNAATIVAAVRGPPLGVNFILFYFFFWDGMLTAARTATVGPSGGIYSDGFSDHRYKF